jgi:hypothetical protein
MDPQKLANLDPKLREVYQRVMGTPAPPPVASTSQNSGPAQPKTPPPTLAQDEIPQNLQPATNPQPQYVPEPRATDAVIKAPDFIQTNHQVPNLSESQADLPTPTVGSASISTDPEPETQIVKNKGGSTKLILLGITVLAAVTVYTLFWTKIFSLSLPFLR